MGSGVRLASLALVAALSAGCAGQTPASSTPASSTPASSSPPVTTTARQSASPCAVGLTLLEAFTQRLADSLVPLRPLATAATFDSAKTVDAIRRVSATMTTFAGLDDLLQACDQTMVLATGVVGLTAAVEQSLKGSLAPTADTQVLRGASVALFALLPVVLDLSASGHTVASQLALDFAVAVVPPDAAVPIGTPVPPPTPAPTATPKPTPGPTVRPTPSPTPSSDWTQAAAETAAAWQQSAAATYLGTLRTTLWSLAYGTSCGPGSTPEGCAAGKADGAAQLDLIKPKLNEHLSWMLNHPAAACFRDGYAADRAVANTYLAWIAAWGPYGDNLTPTALQAADTKADTFLAKRSAYLSDCR